jgi:ABC-type glycerol-3-phosphate transport system substrate-binding protein
MQSTNETAGYHSTEASVMDAGLCCTVPMNISTLRSYRRYADLCYGRVIVIGWPTTTGKGFAAEAASSVGISRYSNCQDEAWDFVCYLLSHDVQSEDIGDYGNVNIRLRRDSQEEAIEKTITSNNAELEKQKQHGNYGSAYLIDEAMGQKYLSYIEQITTSVNRNPAVFRLVKEEAAAYFKGQKSAEDVSKTIQNRVTTLLRESN